MTQTSRFATTHWSVVLAATAQPGSPSAEEALSKLCRTYWYPLYGYARKRGVPVHQAEDLTQAFFSRLLEKGYLQGVSPEKGRFRTFLLVCMKRFLANEWQQARAIKRGGGLPTISINFSGADERYQMEPASNATAERIYERRWALTALEEALMRLAAEMREAGKEPLFDALKVYLAASNAAPAYAETGATIGMSEGAIKVSVFRMRSRYGQLLREEIAGTLEDESAVEDEIRRLFDALRPED